MAEFKKGNIVIAYLFPFHGVIEYVIQEEKSYLKMLEIGWIKKTGTSNFVTIAPRWDNKAYRVKRTHTINKLEISREHFQKIGDTLRDSKPALIKIAFEEIQ